MKKLIFEDSEFPIPDGLDLAAAQKWASEVLPAIENARGSIDEDGNYVFVKVAGEKGM